MEKRKDVLTLVKDDHKFGGNKYVLGKITGIGYCMSGFTNGFATMYIEEGFIYRHQFTVDEYDKFINVIEDLYPGLCVFDYKLRRP